MALIVKMLWESVMNRSGPSPTPTVRDWQVFEVSMGPFDQLPTDIFMQILRLLGPKDAARASSVCRTWKVLVSDNKLWIFFLQNGKEPWDSIVFAETHLRSGFTSMIYSNHSLLMSFMHTYGKREKVPGSVIIDGGSGYCKFGWSKYASPSGRCATFSEFGNIALPTSSRLRHFFTTICGRMQVNPSSQPIIVSIPICHSDDDEASRSARRQLKEAIFTVLFDMNVPCVCAVDQAILALYAARRTSGIVVNIGFNFTSVVPIFRGKVVCDAGVDILGQGALKLTGFLRDKMQQRNMNFGSSFTVQTLKEKLCYVAADYEAELHKDTEASCEVAGEGWFTLSRERFQMGEILFQPQIAGLQDMGLHRAVALCMDRCMALEEIRHDAWFKTVVLTGGTSCLPGLPERLERELIKLLPPSMSDGVKVIPPTHGADSTWFGAKIVSNVSTFHESWCITKKQFHQKFRRNAISADDWQ